MKKIGLSALYLLLMYPVFAEHIYPGDNSMLIRKQYDFLPAFGPYSVAVSSNNMLYLSGLTAFGTPDQVGNTSSQIEAIFSQIKQIAAAEDIGLENLVKITVFVNDMNDLSSVRDVLYAQYNGLYPASSMIQVVGFFHPDLKVEIEAIFKL